MTSRDISFIIGQHHTHLDQAIWHHRGRSGFAFEVATMHESIGEEVLALWFDRSGFFQSLPAAAIDLRVRCGLAATKFGPVAFILWWLPPVDRDGVPFFLKEQVLNPMHDSTRQVIRQLGMQKGLHLAMVGPGPNLVALHEFRNEFGFFELYSYMQAAAERGWPGYDFDIAQAALERDFELVDLLHKKHPEIAVLTGD